MAEGNGEFYDDLDVLGLDVGDPTETIVYDEDGDMTFQAAIGGSDESVETVRFNLLRPKCSVRSLNGSWYIQLLPQQRFSPSEIRGPMRIQVGDDLLRISGDVYVKRRWAFPFEPPVLAPISDQPLLIGKRWYPQLPKKEYSWYFRSEGVMFKNGRLLFKLERHIWDRTTEEFVSQDKGWMDLDCSPGAFRHPRLPAKTARLTGEAMIGGQKYRVVATKTSPYYRGCEVEVDVMTSRAWPETAQLCSGAVTSFTQVYREAGLDFVTREDEVDVPEDASLTIAELQTLLAAHRQPAASPDRWRLWLLVGSNMGGTFGIMFDQTAPHREGAVGFFDPTFSNSTLISPGAQGKKLGEVEDAFLRTLIHEAGHAFNLFHPKHDVHAPAKGTTIMNQTGDVIGFASSTNPYPCNATFGFNDHNGTSLVHAPDPQVRPGWKEFGWGHGNAWSGLAEPIDADGLAPRAPDDEELALRLELPADLAPGEYAVARFTVVNEGDRSRLVPASLDLARGDVQMIVKGPSGHVDQVRDIVVACGERRVTELAPDDDHSTRAQVLYTNVGYTFSNPGLYSVCAEMDTPDGTIVRSPEIKVSVHAPVSEAEQAIAAVTRNDDVGRSIALGDFGTDSAVRRELTTIATEHGDTMTGAAAAMVLANSLDRDHNDYLMAIDSRDAEPREASKYLTIALKGRSAEEAMILATTVASPVEVDAPVVERTMSRLKRTKKAKADMARAESIMDGFAAPSS
jgi:hypothetical protein